MMVKPLASRIQSHNTQYKDTICLMRKLRYPSFLDETAAMAEWILEDTSIADQLDAIRNKIDKHRDEHLNMFQDQDNVVAEIRNLNV